MPDTCERYDSFLYGYNPCNGESVILDGSVIECYSFTTNPAGKEQLQYREVLHGQGTGTFGNEYVANSATNFIIHYNPGQTKVETYDITQTLISKGSAPNIVYTQRYHITITPDGDVVVNREVIDYKCTGAGQ